MPRRNEGQSSRHWVFTINNPTDEDFDNLSFHNWNAVQEAVYNLEVGESGTPHIQGCLSLITHKSLQWMKNKMPRAHIEKRRGSREQAILYCLKDAATQSESTENSLNWLDDLCPNIQTNLSPFPVLFNFQCSWEELKKQCQEKQTLRLPRKEALLTMKTMIEEGKTDQELADFHFPTYISCIRNLHVYRSLVSVQRNFKTKVIICQGPTGTGKSKWAMDNYPLAYWKQRSNWWDGYEGHETVIIDEFYGWLPFDLCLRLCDRYPQLVETKGGNVQFFAKTLIFTSNNLPSSWWKNVYFQSFARRVEEWHVFPVWGEHRIFENYEEALPHFFVNV